MAANLLEVTGIVHELWGLIGGGWCATDPQIHTVDGCGFGGGNCGAEGMAKFLETHWCNSICLYMGLDFRAPWRLSLRSPKMPHPSSSSTLFRLLPGSRGLVPVSPTLCAAFSAA